MNDLVFFSLIMLIFLRVIGLGVSVEFFYDTRDRKFISFMLCWIFWIVANVFPIFANVTLINNLKDLFLIINIILFTLGAIYYFWGFWKYYLTISSKILIILVITSVIIPPLLYFLIDFNIAITYSTVLNTILFLSGYILPPIKKNISLNIWEKQ